MTRSFPLNANRMASSGVLPIMCFNCLKRVGVLRLGIFADGKGSICLIKDVSICMRSRITDARRAALTKGSKTYSGSQAAKTLNCWQRHLMRVRPIGEYPLMLKGLFAVAAPQAVKN